MTVNKNDLASFLRAMASNIEAGYLDHMLVGHAEGVDVDAQNDPSRATLGWDGLWQPPFLMEWVAKAEAKYGKNGELAVDVDLATGNMVQAKIKWPIGFYASASIYDKDGKPARNDLTDEQRANLHSMHNYASGAAALGDSGYQLVYLPVDDIERGGMRIALPPVYTFHPDRLRRDVEDYFKRLVRV